MTDRTNIAIANTLEVAYSIVIFTFIKPSHAAFRRMSASTLPFLDSVRLDTRVCARYSMYSLFQGDKYSTSRRLRLEIKLAEVHHCDVHTPIILMKICLQKPAETLTYDKMQLALVSEIFAIEVCTTLTFELWNEPVIVFRHSHNIIR